MWSTPTVTLSSIHILIYQNTSLSLLLNIQTSRILLTHLDSGPSIINRQRNTTNSTTPLTRQKQHRARNLIRSNRNLLPGHLIQRMHRRQSHIALHIHFCHNIVRDVRSHAPRQHSIARDPVVLVPESSVLGGTKETVLGDGVGEAGGGAGEGGFGADVDDAAVLLLEEVGDDAAHEFHRGGEVDAHDALVFGVGEVVG